MCMAPILVRGSDRVPCGKCPECRSRRVSAWSFRLVHHERTMLNAYFVTLTYSNDNLHFSPNGFMDLNKRALQLFLKRLRKAQQRYKLSKAEFVAGKADLSNAKISYYAVGEYGGRTKRPHYHIILFNVYPELISQEWVVTRCKGGRNSEYVLDNQGQRVPLGFVHIGTRFGGAAVGYTLKYISKGWRPDHRNDDRQRPFSLMSKGIGAAYMSPAMVKWHLNDLENRMYCNLPDGRKCSMPRFYKDHIYNWEERSKIARHFEEVYSIKDQEKADMDLIQLHNLDQAIKAAFRRQDQLKNSITEKI